MLLGAAIAVAFTSRYEVGRLDDIFLWRLDRWTGEVVACRTFGAANAGADATWEGAGCWPVSDEIWSRPTPNLFSDLTPHRPNRPSGAQRK